MMGTQMLHVALGLVVGAMSGAEPSEAIRPRAVPATTDAAATVSALAGPLAVAPAPAGAGSGNSMKTLKADDLFFSADQAVAGTQAVARTVFQGDTIEEFPLEIIGRYRNFAGPGQDVILARLLGDKTAFTGVAGGMSGSPVYVGGKLLGALSYRLGTFSKEAIGGITPIDEMLRAAEFPASGLNATLGKAGAEEQRAGLVPIGTPLLLGGFSREVIDVFSPRLRQLGLEPIQAGSASVGTPRAARPLRPGDPIAAVLVSGDVSVAAAGTLTHIDGKRIYAFGHPFLQSGTVEIPAARATILWTLSSWLASNKIAEIGETVGAIREDRLTAVVGEIGASPATIPVTVDVESADTAARRYSFQISRVKSLVPLLVNLALAGALTNTLEFSSEGTASVQGTIELPGHAPLHFEDLLAGDLASPVGLSAAASVSERIQKIYENPFREPDLTRIAVRLRQVPRIEASTIERISFSTEEIRPGTPFEARLHLRNFRNEPTVRIATLSLPPDALPGPALFVAGEATAVESASGQVPARARVAGARDYATYLDRLSDEPEGGRLLVRLVRPARGTTVGSEMLPDLPPSVLALFATRRAGERLRALGGMVLWEGAIALPGPVVGLRSIPLKIGRPSAPARAKEGS